MPKQERPEPERERVSGTELPVGQHEEDVAKHREHERADEPRSLGAVHGFEGNGRDDEGHHRERLTDVLERLALPATATQSPTAKIPAAASATQAPAVSTP